MPNETFTIAPDEDPKKKQISIEAQGRRLKELKDLSPEKIQILAEHLAQDINFEELNNQEGVYDPTSGMWIPKKS